MKNYIQLIALSVLCSMTACTSEDYTDDPIFDQEIKTELVDKSQLPEWLADYVTYLEYVPEGQELPTEKSGIYRFEWNGETYYEYYSTSQIAMHTDIHKSDGSLFFLKANDSKSFSEGAHNWTIIYMLHPSHEKPKDRIYPEQIQDQEITDFIENALKNGWFRGLDGLSPFMNQMILIDSEKFLETVYTLNDSLPQIDFNKYMLLVGKYRDNRSAILKRQEIIAKDGLFTLNLYFEDNAQDLSSGFRYYWTLYPKLPSDSLLQQRIKNYNMSNTETQNVVTPKAYYQYLRDKMLSQGGVKWYLDSYTTADGIRHQVSDGQGNPNFYIQMDDAHLFGTICGNRFMAKMDQHEEFSLLLSDTPTEVHDADAQYFMQHLGEIKHCSTHNYYPQYYLTLAISDKEIFEFRSETYYRFINLGIFDYPTDIEAFISKHQEASAADFEKYAIGFGWAEIETHRIEGTGNISEKNFWEGMVGGSPSTYEFTKDEFTEFFDADAYPADAYVKGIMRFDQSTGQVVFGRGSNLYYQFTVLSASENEIVVVKNGGVKDSPLGGMMTVYLYVILHRLTDEELQKVKTKYHTHIIDLQSQ